MSEKTYDDIQTAWEEEKQSETLLDLDDLSLGKMSEYLSQVRLALTEVPADDEIQAELYTREIRNLEYMLKDLLMVRRSKIIKAALEHKEPKGVMTLSEEEFYNRISRGFAIHSEFVEATLTGRPVSSQSSEEVAADGFDDTELEYITVRFARTIETPFLGMDERTYGPFQKEDIATIPAANAQPWLRDGTVIRIVIEEHEDRD